MLNKLVLYVLLIKDKLLSKAFRRGKDNNDKNLKNSALVRESEILALLYSYGCSLCPFAVICMYCDLVSICSVTKRLELPQNGLKISNFDIRCRFIQL